MLITLKDLKQAEACQGAVLLFEALFGDSVEVTKELCLKHAHNFDYGFAGSHFLPASVRGMFYQQKNVAEDAWQKAWTECSMDYAEAIKPARKKYLVDGQVPRKRVNKYYAVTEKARRIKTKTCGEINMVLRLAMATAFGDAVEALKATEALEALK